jgi:hypothetical protein
VTDLLQAALSNLLSPMVLFFLLGFAAVKLGSDLAIPEPIRSPRRPDFSRSAASTMKATAWQGAER